MNVGTPYSQAARDAALAAIGGNSFPSTLPELLEQVVIASNANGSGGGSGTSDVNITGISVGEYHTVAASQTAHVLGAPGAIGDYIAGLLVVPATTSPGNVILLDNAASKTVFTGGASSVSNLVPFFIPCGFKSLNGAWKVTTGANVSVIASGNFS